MDDKLYVGYDGHLKIYTGKLKNKSIHSTLIQQQNQRFYWVTFLGAKIELISVVNLWFTA